ncbi:hypothetical protein [Thermotoga sp. KOL6]|uniref:hypothetical protein n=1 Tax=Thermotoga sp. KOL6 TaxID=126741 RepID=UPI000C77CA96|nr:hypothetical protein [Thermotoga sp. KOL6]PLV58377.1 hypothetical protein AS005_08415 [Thermotoga sp. KOL6]
MKPEIQEILKAMKEDPRIKTIVLQILDMPDEEREKFRKKMTYYFMDKRSEIDIEAFKFFKAVLENVEELSKFFKRR